MKNNCYDEIFPFVQGVAIVRKGNKYGAMMLGGKEIFQPIYDFLSNFDNGFATAKYKDEERSVSISGQIQVLKGDEKIFLPEEYDWGYNFIDNICVIVKNGLFGIIDCDYNVLIEPAYTDYDGLKSNHLFLKKTNLFDVFDISGKMVFSNVTPSVNNTYIATEALGKQYGILDEHLTVLHPFIFDSIRSNYTYSIASIDEKRIFLDHYSPIRFTICPGERITIIQRNGKFVVFNSIFIKQNVFKKIYIYDLSGNKRIEYTCAILRNDNDIIKINTFNEDSIVLESITGNTFIIDNNGVYLVSMSIGVIHASSPILNQLGRASVIPHQSDIIINTKIPIMEDYLYYRYYTSHEGFLYVKHIISGNLGISDKSGKVQIEPQFGGIELWKKDNFIAGRITSISNKNRISYGIINTSNDIILPFDYNYLNGVNDNLIAFSKGDFVEVNKNSNNGYGFISNSFPKYGGPYGLLNSDFEIICSPKFTSIEPLEGENYFKVFCSKKWGIIDMNGRFVILDGSVKCNVPHIFEWASNSVDDYIIVMINSKWGIADKHYNIVIPCCYDDIEYFSKDLYVFRENDKVGLITINNKIILEPIYKSIKPVENNLFKIEGESNKYGFTSIDGETIVPAEFIEITPIDISKFFYLVKSPTGKYGLYKGKKVFIPAAYDIIEVLDDSYKCIIKNRKNYSYNSCFQKDFEINYNYKGEVIMYFNGAEFCVPSEYDMAFSSEDGFFRVMQDGKWGVMDLKKELIVPTLYAYIGEFQGGFAVFGKGEGVFYNILDKNFREKLSYGLIDIMGEVVLAPEYDFLSYDHGYWIYYKNGKYGLISPSITVITPPTYTSIVFFENSLFIVTGEKYHDKGLIDGNGKEILPPGSFDEIELFSDGFFKLTRNSLPKSVSIANRQGKRIIDSYDIFNVSEFQKGIWLLQYNHREEYNIATMQGKVILPGNFKTIKNLKDGRFIKHELLSISDGLWGVADILGNIIIEPLYCDELSFKKDISNISVKGTDAVQKINISGRVIVHNGEKDALLPEGIYWGTDFVNGISIVRREENGTNIGAINENANIVIPTKYESVKLFSNNTFIVQHEDCYGLFDINGNTILPVIFLTLEYVAEDRIRVRWNLSIAEKWEGQSYKPGISNCKRAKSDNDFRYNNRSALCNLRGEIVNNKNILYVDKFVGKFARVYKEITMEEELDSWDMPIMRVKMKQVGVIDISGKTIIEPIYDGIMLYKNSPYIKFKKDGQYGVLNSIGEVIIEPIYENIGKINEHPYIKVQKSGIWGIIDLKTKAIHMFENLDIKHLGDFDKLGRCVYSEDFDEEREEDYWYHPTFGVIGINGVIVESGKYYNIELLDNGLIKVSDKSNYKYGLLDKNGKEILPVKYSYISWFKGKYATIRLTEYDAEKIDKWGVIDENGHFVKECISDEEEIIKENDCIDNVVNNKQDSPLVILSDKVPQLYDNDSYDSYAYAEDNDDGYYSKYGGYNGWDDDTIDEAFDGDPGLTWNID